MVPRVQARAFLRNKKTNNTPFYERSVLIETTSFDSFYSLFKGLI